MREVGEGSALAGKSGLSREKENFLFCWNNITMMILIIVIAISIDFDNDGCDDKSRNKIEVKYPILLCFSLQ